jgi:hypothetical protein
MTIKKERHLKAYTRPIRALVLSCLFIGSVLSTASAADLTICLHHGKLQGDGMGKRVIPKDCPALIKTQAAALNNRLSEDQQQRGYTYRDMLYIENTESNKTALIAGSSTFLEEQKALRFFSNEIFVLTRDHGVLVYTTRLPGNIAPIRRLAHTEIDFAQDVEVDDNYLYLLLKEEIIVFDVKANSNAVEQRRRDAIIKRISLPTKDAKSIALDRLTGEIYLLANDKVFKISPNKSQVTIVESSQALRQKTALEFTERLIIK